MEQAQATRKKAEARIRKMCDTADKLWEGTKKAGSGLAKTADGLLTIGSNVGKGILAGTINTLAKALPTSGIGEALTGSKAQVDLSGGKAGIDYKIGEMIGGLGTAIAGGLASVAGIGMTGAGGVTTVSSGGAASPVSIPTTTTGVVITVSGARTLVSGGTVAVDAIKGIFQQTSGGDGGNEEDTSNWGGKDSQKNAEKHYEKHGDEVGAKDFDDYMRKADSFKNTVLDKVKKPSNYVSGETPNVYRYNYNGKYIDLEHIMGTDLLGQPKITGYSIISYGSQ